VGASAGVAITTATISETVRRDITGSATGAASSQRRPHAAPSSQVRRLAWPQPRARPAACAAWLGARLRYAGGASCGSPYRPDTRASSTAAGEHAQGQLWRLANSAQAPSGPLLKIATPA
jgi:hypothetical protein